MFDGDGRLRHQYVGTTAMFICLGVFSDSGSCSADAFIDVANDVAKGLPPAQLDRGTTQTLQETIGDRTKTPNIGRILQVSAVLAVVAKLYRDATRTDDREAAIRRGVEECYRSDVLDVIDYLGDLHPCDRMPMFLPGETDAGGAALNDAAAIASDRTKIVLQYVPGAERKPIIRQALIDDGQNFGNPRQWYLEYSPCNQGYDADEECDEYPFFSSNRSGPPTTDTSLFGTRLEIVSAAENRLEGNAYGAFTQACPAVNAREPFLVVPLVGAASAPTDWVCPL